MKTIIVKSNNYESTTISELMKEIDSAIDSGTQAWHKTMDVEAVAGHLVETDEDFITEVDDDLHAVINPSFPKTIKQLLNEANEIRDSQEMAIYEIVVDNDGYKFIYSAGSFIASHPRHFLEKFISDYSPDNTDISKRSNVFSDLKPELLPEDQRALTAIKNMERLKDQYKEAAEELEAALTEIGEGANFQDASGVVYLVTSWEGQWVRPKVIDYKRTRTAEEKAAKIPGKLSLTKARELGYVVEGK